MAACIADRGNMAFTNRQSLAARLPLADRAGLLCGVAATLGPGARTTYGHRGLGALGALAATVALRFGRSRGPVGNDLVTRMASTMSPRRSVGRNSVVRRRAFPQGYRLGTFQRLWSIR